jgi:indolepyruvate ferredoxin oxidoreductase beta subunit
LWSRKEGREPVLAHDPYNIIISGVGGQGNILASDIISRAFCDAGLFVSVGETYGATQRGGSVSSHIRLSERHLYGPLIPLGQGHVMIGFEPLELYRILSEFGHADARVVVNDRPFYPLDALQRKGTYPPLDTLVSAIGALTAELKVIQGTDLAREAGNPQAQNVVMVGAFVGLHWIPMEKEAFVRAIEETFSGPKRDVNRRAFELGYQAARNP